MSHVVHVNDASPTQLRILLRLTPQQLQTALDARPFADAAAFRRSVPAVDRDHLQGLSVPLLELNQATAEELVSNTGIDANIAQAIVARKPYYLPIEIQHVPGMTPQIFAAVTELYTVHPFQYTDKLSGQPVGLSPDLSHLLIRVNEADIESASHIAGSLRLRSLSVNADTNTYQVFAVPESETGTDTIRSLKESDTVQEVVPSFRDQDRVPRFLDPEFCVVQFSADTSVERQEAIVKELGLEIETRHRSPGLVTVKVLGGTTEPGRLFRAIASLNQRPEVVFAEPGFIGVGDLERSGLASRSVASSTTPWNLNLVNAAEAWTDGTGSPDVVVALIDTGVDESHGSIQHALLPRSAGDDWNFADGGDGTPKDTEGHGTFIAGIIAGNGLDGVRGISPGCRILPLKIPVSGTSLSYAQRRDAILYALSRVPQGSRLIINISWKTTGDIALIRDAISTAINQGAIIVCSAGNWPEMADQPHYPSDYPSVFSVAGVDPNGRRGIYSFYGSKIAVSAPGGSGSEDPESNIISAMPGGGTRADFGTSFAAPHVVGVIALLLSLDPTLTVEEIRHILQTTATPLQDDGLGSGLVNAAASVALARLAAPERPVDESSSEALNVINSASAADLVQRYGLAALTAQIIVARRPYAEIEDIRGTLGLTDAQFALIAGSQTESGPSPGAAAPDANSGHLVDVNRASLAELLAIPGMPRFTAAVILARRPIASTNDLAPIAGMTPDVLSKLRVA